MIRYRLFFNFQKKQPAGTSCCIIYSDLITVYFVPFGHESYPQVDADAIGIAKNIVKNMDEINVLVFLMIIFFWNWIFFLLHNKNISTISSSYIHWLSDFGDLFFKQSKEQDWKRADFFFQMGVFLLSAWDDVAHFRIQQ